MKLNKIYDGTQRTPMFIFSAHVTFSMLKNRLKVKFEKNHWFFFVDSYTEVISGIVRNKPVFKYNKYMP